MSRLLERFGQFWCGLTTGHYYTYAERRPDQYAGRCCITCGHWEKENN